MKNTNIIEKMRFFLVITFFVSFFIVGNSVYASNQWVWVKGDNSLNSLGNYGTKGIPAATNKPGARENALTWTDPAGRFWVYGYAASGGIGYLNDLWRFDPGTNYWTWCGGDNVINVAGVYGTKGVTASTNKPGGRNGAVVTTDANGNIWMYGGQGYGTTGLGYLNDLWFYNTTIYQWMWVAGDVTAGNTGVYGIQGTYSSTNKPGGKYKPLLWNTTNEIWLFGGLGFASSTTLGSMNDMWKYSKTTNQWCFVKGSNVVNQTGVYGSSFSSSNSIGARSAAVSWTNSSGNLVVYSGNGLATSATVGRLNDFWEYSIALNQWKFVNGDNVINSTGVYGGKNVFAPTNKPGARMDASVCKDNSGNIYLFGGYGNANSSSQNSLNDLWMFNNNGWVWIGGDNTLYQTGVYGTLNIANSTNKIGARNRSTVFMDLVANKMYIFGGKGLATTTTTGDLNDMWRLDFCMNPLILSQTYDLYKCEGNDLTLSVNASGTNISYTWYVNAGSGFVPIGTNPQYVGASTPTLQIPSCSLSKDGYQYHCVIQNACGYTTSVNVTIHISALPIVTVTGNLGVCSGQSTTLTAAGATTYLWSTGATTPSVTVPYSSTAYWVIGYSGNCSSGYTYVNTTSLPLPTVNGGVDQAVCSGTPVTLSATGTAATYSWSPSIPSIITNGTAFTPIATQNYTVTGTGSNGCINSDQVLVTVKPFPVVNAGIDQVICSGNSVTLTAAGTATSYTWSPAIANGQSFIPTNTQVYTLTGLLNSCANTDQVLVTVTPLPVVTISGNLTVCQNQGTTLTASGATSYVWNTGVTTPSTFVSPNFTTTYTVSGYNGSCMSQVSTTVNVNPANWTWMHGIDPNTVPTGYGGSSNYGTIKVASPTNLPSGRSGAATWTDINGNLWMFGGTAVYDATTPGLTTFGPGNNLWKYDPLTNQWTWMSGSKMANNNGVLGPVGQASTNYYPSARINPTTWTDGNNLFELPIYFPKLNKQWF